MSAFDPTLPPEGTLVIRTARDEEAMNEAVKQGFRPLVKLLTPSPRIKSKLAVYQHKVTGEVKEIVDFRDHPDAEVWTKVIPWTHYYPYFWPSPYAAYLLPPDLETGDTVWLEDLIEDVVGTIWNQGSAWRLPSCMAVWTGEDFDLLFDEKRDRGVIMG